MNSLIVLDPGHGGRDPGAVGNGLQEKIVVWNLALKVKKKLAGYDCRVEVVQPSTRKLTTAVEEVYMPPKEANEMAANFYLSLHLNAGGGRGFESYVIPKGVHPKYGQSVAIRSILHGHLAGYLKRFEIIDRGQKEKNLAVLRKVNCPSVLLEYVFIDNTRESWLLEQDGFLDGLANETAYGLVLALGLKRR